MACQVTEKLVPSLDSLAGMASFTLFFSIVISWMADAGNDPMGPFVELSLALQVPLTLVWSSPKSTSVKLARGRTPLLLEGASAIHSADDRFAPETDAVLEKVFPVVSFVIVMVNFELL